MMRRFECIAEDLGSFLYFVSYGEVEEFLTPFSYEAVQVCLRQGQCFILSLSSFLGSACDVHHQVPEAELITFLFHGTLVVDMGQHSPSFISLYFIFILFHFSPSVMIPAHSFLPPHRGIHSDGFGRCPQMFLYAYNICCALLYMYVLIHTKGIVV